MHKLRDEALETDTYLSLEYFLAYKEPSLKQFYSCFLRQAREVILVSYYWKITQILFIYLFIYLFNPEILKGTCPVFLASKSWKSPKTPES